VNHSDWSFTPAVGQASSPATTSPVNAIRFGLGAVKNLGQSAVEAIVRARDEIGPFRSLHQFCERVDLTAVNKRMIESLIRAGAMDSLEGTRSQKVAVLDSAMESGQRAWRDRECGQVGLFGEMAHDETHSAQLPKVPDWSDKEKLAAEKEMLGFWVTGHPLDRYADKIAELATHDSSRLEGLSKGAEVTLCGVLTGIIKKRNRDGKPWVSMAIEDRNGSIEAMVFASSFERIAAEVVEDRAVLIRGQALPEDNAPPKISVQDIVPLDNARLDVPAVISIRVWLGRNGTTDKAQALESLFARKPGETQVRLRLELPRDFSLLLDVPVKVKPDREFRAEVEQICGPECLEKVAG
jgi:DNA polymerase-3 subunit alpha